MENDLKLVGEFQTPFGQGYVINADTPEERRKEINSFYIDEWIPTLQKLNEDLEAINPDYTLVQLKLKFGELSLYAIGIGDEGCDLVRQATYDLWYMEHPKVAEDEH